MGSKFQLAVRRYLDNISLGTALLRSGKIFLVGLAIAGLLVTPAQAAELRPDTADGFDRYIRAAELRMAEDLREGRFLIMDRLPDGPRQEVYAQVREGQIYIAELHTAEDGRAIQIPGGLVHHWVGAMFVPDASIVETVSILEDYNNHKNIYKPDVRESKLLEQNGNEFKVYLQLYRKSLVTVVVNVNADVRYTVLSAKRVMSKSYSTRIAEVEDAGKPGEHELPVGNDHGYIWRLYSYWRIEEGDGGVYVQVESVGLSRTIPWAFAWLVKPLTRSIPQAALARLLEATRTAVRTAARPPAVSQKAISSGSADLVKEVTRRVGA